MKRAMLLSSLFAASLLAQSSQPPQMSFLKISSRQMASVGLPVSGPDTLQVWVGTSNSDTKAFRVSVRYSWQAQTFSDARTVDRSWLPFSGAIFVIPDVGIRVLSITVEELKTSCSVEFVGEP
jgi:hypothetical protein